MEEKKTLWLLYFGRLDDEKWFWLILEMLNMFIKKHWTIPFSFYVFWKWKHTQELMNLGQKYSSIHFFWRQSIENIRRYHENCDFCLVPSTFLETFGLTALNSLSMWIPVIWFAKWWLSQFVDSKYDISKVWWIDDAHKLFNLVESVVKDYNSWNINFEKEKKKALSIAKKYTIEKRCERAEELFGKPKRILLVSDFKSKLWWIETYIHDAADILEDKWYEVKIYGTEIPNWFLWNMLRKFWLVLSLWNFVDAIRLKRVARKFMPKVIRYHSTLRWLGRYPIKLLLSHKSKKFVMYHDLWYFHPYPSQVIDEKIIKTPLNLKNFVSSANTKNPIKIIAMFFKYICVKLLSNQLKKSVDTHLVPSEFMESIVCDSFKLNSKKVKTFSHFVQ